ncbi:MAG: 2OG-Fe dioxygenase family protein [Acidiphilium sp.]|nr:2OG-Fe dioxygenase family protein [Acidiphilium sp.]MDD4934251.1 2OG-Fe dioxygenase family protein [Acidiphilium sp.]
MNAISKRHYLAKQLHTDGFAFLDGAALDAMLPAGVVAPEAWNRFAASWDGMPLDTYMADGGRYRRRRFGVFTAAPNGEIRRAPHQPHYQARDYNILNGGVERWFEPIDPAVADGASFQALLGFTRALFEEPGGEVAWHIEAHQFRIEAGPDGTGLPTPEGMHRDGVDFVLVLMVRRVNIEQGTTTIHDLHGDTLGSFTLTHPRDAALVDDRRVFHGVTPVVPIDPGQPAFRDVLVLTYRRF